MLRMKGTKTQSTDAARPSRNAPNIVLILLDDIGFADPSTFGGLAHTPELSKLAAEGLRYNNFHTAGICSATRAALLSGRNHHRIGFGGLPELSAEFVGYNCSWKRSAVSIAELLRRNGYATAAFGKWHNTPICEITPLGPYDRWPTSLGFDYYYGFMGAMESQWEPSAMYRNTTPIAPAATENEAYHLTNDIVNEAIGWLKLHESLATERPYFLYLATGAVHAPHHAPSEWIERYQGVFDRGWDVLNLEIFTRQKEFGVVPRSAELSARPVQIPAWEGLSEDHKKLFARQMEVYAGFIGHTDHEVGRLIGAVQCHPHADNTLILYIVGDNGSASGTSVDGCIDALTSVGDQLKRVEELGGARVPLNHYALGWTWLGSTPFKFWKGVASHFGAVRDPLIVSWPAGIKGRGAWRSQFTHVVDVAPTICDIVGIPLPESVDGAEQQPFDGVSFAHTFDDENVRSNHITQYFETLGNRAIYHNGWVAAASHQVLPGEFLFHPNFEYSSDNWELYNVQEDFSQARDLARERPDKLKDLKEIFETEARQNNVYPLGAGLLGREGVPFLAAGRREYKYRADLPRLDSGALPVMSGESFLIVADTTIPEDGAHGVIFSYGGRLSGFVLYVEENRVFYESKSPHGERQIVTSNTLLRPGSVKIAFEYTRTERVEAGPRGMNQTSIGIGRLAIDGEVVAEAAVSGCFGFGALESLGVGQAFGSPVSDSFQLPNKFTGTVECVKLVVGTAGGNKE